MLLSNWLKDNLGFLSAFRDNSDELTKRIRNNSGSRYELLDYKNL